MWGDIYSDFLGYDIARVVERNYDNPLSVLGQIADGDFDLLVDVLGKVKALNMNWDKFSVSDFINSSALPIAVCSIAFDIYNRWHNLSENDCDYFIRECKFKKHLENFKI